MAGFYGMQFEALMKEVCVDFGRRLVMSWDENAPKEEVMDFVSEAVETFFKRTKGLEVRMEVETEEKPKKAVGKKKVEAEAEAEEPEEKPKKAVGKKKAVSKKKVEVEEEPKKAKKAKAGAKPKCEAVTAKGTQCSKCAMEGEVFCSVHLKKKEAEETTEPKEKKKVEKAKKGGKKEELKHTHEMGEEPEKECELCETHGEAFEIPEYEVENEEEEMDDDRADPDWKLEEEDFFDDD